jgi:hypothetical protein
MTTTAATPSLGTRVTVDASDWFQVVFGKTEAEWLAADASEKGLRFRKKWEPRFGPHVGVVGAGGRILDAGCFSVWSLQDLEAEGKDADGSSAPKPLTAKTRPVLPLDIYVRKHDGVPVQFVDVNALHCNATPGTMFQVASNFNCMEIGRDDTDPRHGAFVTHLMSDYTQGPGAACACAVSALVRTHACFVEDDASTGITVATGQHFAGPQIELLGDARLAPYFPVDNGKLFACEPRALSKTAKGDLDHGVPIGAVRVGLHVQAQAMFRRCPPHKCEIAFAGAPVVDQVYVAAMNMGARSVRFLTKAAVNQRMRFLLRAAYRGTYAAGVVRKTKILVLTLVGGGVFRNPLGAIGDAIGEAHARWADAGRFERIVLPIFTAGPAVIEDLVAGIRAQGVRVNVHVLE